MTCLTDEQVDEALRFAILLYDPKDKYPEWSNNALREAYRAGHEDGREALASLRASDQLAAFRKALAEWNDRDQNDHGEMCIDGTELAATAEAILAVIHPGGGV